MFHKISLIIPKDLNDLLIIIYLLAGLMFLIGGILLTWTYVIKNKKENPWEELDDNFSKGFISIWLGFFSLLRGLPYAIGLTLIIQTILINLLKTKNNEALILEIIAISGLFFWIIISIISSSRKLAKIDIKNTDMKLVFFPLKLGNRWIILEKFVNSSQVHITISIVLIIMFLILLIWPSLL